MRRLRLLGAVGLLAACAEPTDQAGVERVVTPPASLVAAGYQVVDLGFRPTEVSNSGHVLGHVLVAAGNQAVVWEGGTTTILGTLGGTYSLASDMSERGEVVGRSGDAGDVHELPFFWRPPSGPITQVPLPAFLTDGQATAISDNGMYVVGEMRNPLVDAPSDGFVWDGSALVATPLVPPLLHSLQVHDVNNAGHVVGYVCAAVCRIFFWNGTTMEDVGPQGGVFLKINNADLILDPLGTLWSRSGTVWMSTGLLAPGCTGGGAALNDHGHVVGSRDCGAGTRAFLWSMGATTDLGLVNPTDQLSAAVDVGNRLVAGDPQIVGQSLTVGGVSLPFTWQGAPMLQLPFPAGYSGSPNSEALSVNDVGWVVGGHPRGLLWQPVPVLEIEILIGGTIFPLRRERIVVTALSTQVANGESVDFDATQIDVATVRFGPAEAVALRVQLVDKGRDGDQDMQFQFDVGQTGISCSDTQAQLKGQTRLGLNFIGTRQIRVICAP